MKTSNNMMWYNQMRHPAYTGAVLNNAGQTDINCFQKFLVTNNVKICISYLFGL
jgi:hypothetical protein